MAVLFIDNSNGHVENATFSGNDASKAGAFLAEYGEGLTEIQRGKLMIYDALTRAQDATGKIIYGSNQETRDEIWNKAFEILTAEGHGYLIGKIAR